MTAEPSGAGGMPTVRRPKVRAPEPSDNYVPYNPQLPGGMPGMGAAPQSIAKQGMTMKYDRIKQVLGEGGVVLTISEGAFAGNRSRSTIYGAYKAARPPNTEM